MPTLIDLLDRTELDAVSQPLNRAWTLPPAAYTDAAVFEREVERLFSRAWICVGRVEQVASPGDFLCVDLPAQPIVITRDRSGDLNALSRICLHRGMPLVGGSGNARRLTCPYHKWVYELDGRLRGAPMMEGAENFSERDCRLPRLALEVWHGFLFVNLNPDAAPLTPQLRGLERLIGNYGFENLVIAETLHFDSPWNWKILVENFMEAYHHIGTHKESLEPLYPSRQSTIPDNDGEPWAFLWMPGLEAVAEDSVVFPDLTTEERNGLFAACVFPTFLFAATGHSGIWYQLVPRAHDRMDLKIHVLLPPDVVEGLSEEERRGIGEAVSAIHLEDVAANEGPWQGLHGALTVQGRLSLFEKAIWQLNQYWVGQMK